MQIIADSVFRNVRSDPDLVRSAAGLEFRNCTFDGCTIAVPRSATKHALVSNVTLQRCTMLGGAVRGLHLREVSVERCKLTGSPQILGCVFEHVRIAGHVKQLLISGDLPTVDDPLAFVDESHRQYSAIDWALDITDLECPDLSILGVPGQLIRRDSDRQVVVRRERVQDGRWREIDFEGTDFGIGIQQMLRQGWPEIVLAAVTGGGDAARTRAVIRDLLAAGIAE